MTNERFRKRSDMKKVVVSVVLIIFVIFFCMCVSHASLCEFQTAHEISKAQLRPLAFS